jgi:hypothetical protein
MLQARLYTIMLSTAEVGKGRLVLYIFACFPLDWMFLPWTIVGGKKNAGQTLKV